MKKTLNLTEKEFQDAEFAMYQKHTMEILFNEAKKQKIPPTEKWSNYLKDYLDNCSTSFDVIVNKINIKYNPDSDKLINSFINLGEKTITFYD